MALRRRRCRALERGPGSDPWSSTQGFRLNGALVRVLDFDDGELRRHK